MTSDAREGQVGAEGVGGGGQTDHHGVSSRAASAMDVARSSVVSIDDSTSLPADASGVADFFCFLPPLRPLGRVWHVSSPV
mmetsp:Transcript_10344/g.23657  ORF Transcript_10344/g.23657 Transcript_10344/m.23657 type:complete len:81 (+) Transcript_10344:88-330(+)